MTDKYDIDLTQIEKQWLALPKETRDAEIAIYQKIDDRDKLEALKIRNEYDRLGNSTAEFLAIYTRYIWRQEVKAKNKLSPNGNHILDRNQH